MKLKGKVTIITGASGGIGKTTSKKLLDEGSKVVIVGRNKSKLKRAAEELNDNNNVLSITSDVSHESEVLNVVEQTLSAFDKIDILINCAAKSMTPCLFI